MGSGSDPKKFNPQTNKVTQHLANPLGLGSNKTTKFLADPLGLFGGGEKRPFVYEEGRIYTNPAKAERARQITIQRGTEAVNKVFDDPARQQQQMAFLKALRDFYGQDLNRQKQTADRTRRFSVARSGLAGGSADADSSRMLGEEYTKGLLDMENRAQAGYNDLVSRNEAARLDLLAQVRAGMDTTTAAARSAAATSPSTSGPTRCWGSSARAARANRPCSTACRARSTPTTAKSSTATVRARPPISAPCRSRSGGRCCAANGDWSTRTRATACACGSPPGPTSASG